MSATFSFEAELKAGEEILWVGNGSGRNLSASVISAPLIVFGLMLAFFVHAMISGFQGAHIMMLVVGTAIFAVTLGYSRIIYASPPTERYCITSHRVMIAPELLGGIPRSFVAETSNLKQNGDRQFKRIKVFPKRKSVYFEPHVILRGRRSIVPIFVGVDDAEQIGKLAAETFQMKLVIS